MTAPPGDAIARRTDRFRAESLDQRSPGQRDRDRILYCSAFQRLAKVTQVVSPDEAQVFHNRLTHSLKVAQLARRLAEKLVREQPDVVDAVGGVDPDTTEAAALAHDLGHPPFGHTAEEELRTRVSEAGLPDGFEGNAQSFRIVTRLAVRFPDGGLNLTRATLNALLKYPWKRKPGQRKFGAYESDLEHFDWARAPLPPRDERKTAEAELMDWADDVTYAVHDLADFYSAGLIPLDRLSSRKDDAERVRFLKDVFDVRGKGRELELRHRRQDLEEAFLSVAKIELPFERFTGTRAQRFRLRAYTSTMIGRYLGAVRLKVPTSTTDRFVEIDRELEMQVTMLKELTWTYVIENPSLVMQQRGHCVVIGELFRIFHEAALGKKNLRLLPPAIREQLDSASPDPEARIVADYIAGMTERQALNTFLKLTGVVPGSAFQ